MNRHFARVALSLSAVAGVTVPLFFAPGCLSSPASNDGGGGSSSSGGSGSSGSGSSSGSTTDDGGSSSGGPTGCLPPGPDAGPVDPTCVIDDMTDQAVASGGYWYTYSDRTFPNTTDVVDGSAVSMGTVIATSAGMISPVEGAMYPPSTGDMAPGGPTVPGLSAPAGFREFSGSGLTLWGAGMGFNWTNVIADDASMGDAADAAPALGNPGPYPVNPVHHGISFYGKSNGSGSVSVGVHMSDARQAAAGGLCDATVYVNNPVECGDDYFKAYTFTTSWQNFTVRFKDLKTQNYSGMGLAPGGLDTTQLYQVHFQVNNAAFAGKGATDAGPPFDISVAYITWYDGN